MGEATVTTNDELSGATILVISDDSEMARLICLNLQRRGFIVEQADLARAQSQRWRPVRERPDLLILDLENPERVSPNDVRDLSARPWARSVPFIVVTESAPALRELLSSVPRVVVIRWTDIGKILHAAQLLLGTRPAPASPVIMVPTELPDEPGGD